MNEGKQTLLSALELALAPHGFVRKGSLLTRRSEEVVQSLELQKSQWGHQYYLNVGVWLTILGSIGLIQDKDMHVRIRADSLLEEEAQKKLSQCLDLEQSVNGFEREEQLQEIVGKSLLPKLQYWRSIAGLRDDMKLGLLASAFLAAVARKALEQR